MIAMVRPEDGRVEEEWGRALLGCDDNDTTCIPAMRRKGLPALSHMAAQSELLERNSLSSVGNYEHCLVSDRVGRSSWSVDCTAFAVVRGWTTRHRLM